MTTNDDRAAPRFAPVGALVVLNAVLLVLLGMVTFAESAGAQPRVRGSYTMAAGRVNGLEPSAVYIVDTVNLEMLVVAYNPNTKQLEGIGHRSLAVDMASVSRGPGRSGN